MPFFKVTGKMIDFNETTNRYEKYLFEEVVFGASTETAANFLLQCWRSDPNTNRKVLNPKVVVRHIVQCEENTGISFKKTFLEVVDPATYKHRSVTTRLNDRPYRK